MSDEPDPDPPPTFPMRSKRNRLRTRFWTLGGIAAAAAAEAIATGSAGTITSNGGGGGGLETLALTTVLSNLAADRIDLRPPPPPPRRAHVLDVKHADANDNPKGDDPAEERVCTPSEYQAEIASKRSRRCDAVRYTYARPCSSPYATLQESTGALLAVRALAKTAAASGGDGNYHGNIGGKEGVGEVYGDDDDHSGSAWEILDSVWSAGGANGFLPRYRYPTSLMSSSNDTAAAAASGESGRGSDDAAIAAAVERRTATMRERRRRRQQQPLPPYLPNTSFPSPTLFGAPPLSYRPPLPPQPPPPRQQEQHSGTVIIPTSGRVSSPPFHSTLALETFYLSNQTDADLRGLGRSYGRLVRWHRFLHMGVMRGCGAFDDDDDGTNDDDNDGPGAKKGGIGGSRSNSRNDDYASEDDGNETTAPCYNVVHPWETDLPHGSPLWPVALRPVIDRMIRGGGAGGGTGRWEVPFDVPREVAESYDHPADGGVYNATIWLLECHKSAAADFEAERQRRRREHQRRNEGDVGGGVPYHSQNEGADPPPPEQDDYAFEPYLISRCPFALLNVGYAAALSKADADLLEIGRILRDERAGGRAQRPSRSDLDAVARWSVRSRKVLNSLWDEDRRAYLSRAVRFAAAPATVGSVRMGTGMNGTTPKYVGNGSVPLDVPVSDNFLAVWDDIVVANPEERVTSLTYQLLQREGRFGFNCGEYPIWSVGGLCDDDATTDAPSATTAAAAAPHAQQPAGQRVIIDPTLNYWVSAGLLRNGASGMGRYVRNSTLDLVCGLPNAHDSNLTSCAAAATAADLNFSAAYDARTGVPASADACVLTSTATASAVYNAMVPDKPFRYRPAPPLSSSWVIVLIAIELAVAIGIGVSCLLLSVGVMRRLKADDDTDEFVRLLRSQRADASFLYGEENGVGGGGYGGGGWHDAGPNLAEEEGLGGDEVNSAAAAIGVGAELERLQNCPESPIIRATSPLRTVQRYLYRDILRSPWSRAEKEEEDGVDAATDEDEVNDSA